MLCPIAQVLLDYQLSMHEDYLRAFHDCFESVDTDEDGEINEVLSYVGYHLTRCLSTNHK